MFKAFAHLNPVLRGMLDSAILIAVVTIIFQSGAVYDQIKSDHQDITEVKGTMTQVLQHVASMDATMTQIEKNQHEIKEEVKK